MWVILYYRARNFHRAFNQNNRFPKTYHVYLGEQINFSSSLQSTFYSSNGKNKCCHSKAIVTVSHFSNIHTNLLNIFWPWR